MEKGLPFAKNKPLVEYRLPIKNQPEKVQLSLQIPYSYTRKRTESVM